MQNKSALAILIYFINLCLERYGNTDYRVDTLTEDVINYVNENWFNKWIDDWIDMEDDYEEFRKAFMKWWKKKWGQSKLAQETLARLWLAHAPKFDKSLDSNKEVCPPNDSSETVPSPIEVSTDSV